GCDVSAIVEGKTQSVISSSHSSGYTLCVRNSQGRCRIQSHGVSTNSAICRISWTLGIEITITLTNDVSQRDIGVTHGSVTIRIRVINTNTVFEVDYC